MNSKIYRIIIDIIILLCLLQGWWIIALPLAAVSYWFFPYYVELMMAGIIFDSLFGFVREMGVWGYIGTIVTFSLTMIGFVAKRMVR